ncbi:MAG: hypothetical protein RR012_08530 [Oscillospiraceae bacterium]
MSSLNYNKKQLSSFKKKLKALEEQLDSLQEFAIQCSSHIGSFESSMAKRKNKLNVFDGFLDKVKSAVRYKQKMSDMLSGSEYSATVACIDQLQNSVASEKSKTINDIRYIEQRISELESRVSNLQYQYDTYPEEVQPNGE